MLNMMPSIILPGHVGHIRVKKQMSSAECLICLLIKRISILGFQWWFPLCAFTKCPTQDGPIKVEYTEDAKKIIHMN